MADNTPDNSTDWIGLGVHCFRRATRSAFKSFPEVERIIERDTLEEVFSGELDIRWLDYSGHECVGVPFGCGSAFGFTSSYHYDQSADALKPWNRSGLVGSGPVLYRPQVRERQRKPANPAGMPTGEPAVKSAALTTDPARKSDDKSDKVDLSEIETEVNRCDGADTKPDNFDKPITPRRWPWDERRDSYSDSLRTKVARCRKDLKRLFQPDDILDFGVQDILDKLAERGCQYRYTTVSRAMQRKNDRAARVSPIEPNSAI